MIGYGLGQTVADDLDRAGISHYILSGYCGSSESATGTGDDAQVPDLYADQQFLRDKVYTYGQKAMVTDETRVWT